MKSYISEKKERISSYLSEFISGYGPTLESIHPMGEDLSSKLLLFTLKGKMVRGALVSLGYELFAPFNETVTIPLGAVQELFQSALLIHDDIMDRDRQRRGSPSIYAEYITLAEEKNLSEPVHIGEALGICAGDIAYFLAFEILSKNSLPDHIITRLLALCSKELTLVGVAQMIDVLWGADRELRSVDEIIHLYTYKTARYTFSLPLMAGALSAGETEEVVSSLEAIGTQLGILFQIKDDELGMFGGKDTIGKPIGSDIREGKKTLYYHHLINSAECEDKQYLLSFFGNSNITDEDIGFVQKRIEQLGIKEKVEATVKAIAEDVSREIKMLDCRDEKARGLLMNFLAYSLERTY
jgi:geranylgeranyl diphosphate synthase type I